MMGTCPDIDKDERPEMDDRKAIAVDRAIRGFGKIVIHQSEKRRGKKEGDSVMAVPPLNQRILNASINRIAFQKADRNFNRIHDVKNRDGDNRGDVEPNGNIEMTFTTTKNSSEKIDGKDDPDDGNRNIDRPFKLGIFFSHRISERKSKRGRNDDQLPSPKMDFA